MSAVTTGEVCKKSVFQHFHMHFCILFLYLTNKTFVFQLEIKTPGTKTPKTMLAE